MSSFTRHQDKKIKDSFLLLGVMMLTARPESIRTLKFSKFKNKLLKRWLAAKPFYSLSEYFEADKSELGNIKSPSCRSIVDSLIN